MRNRPSMPPEVKAAFGRIDPKARESLMEVRDLIFATADDVDAGPLTETLKWGEPAYLTEASKSGTTLRLGQPKGQPSKCAIFVPCQTTLVAEFRETLDDPLIALEGNRAILFAVDEALPREGLRHCIAQALTYKRR